MFSVIQVNRIYLIFNLVHFLVDSSEAQTKVWGQFLPLMRLRSASKASRQWISTGESWYWVLSQNLSYSVSALSSSLPLRLK